MTKLRKKGTIVQIVKTENGKFEVGQNFAQALKNYHSTTPAQAMLELNKILPSPRRATAQKRLVVNCR